MLVPLGKENAVLKSQIYASIVCAILCLVLIPSFGLIGASFVALITELTVFVVQCFCLPKEYRYMLKEIFNIKALVSSIAALLVALMLKNHGYRVIDLGKDVSTDEIIRTAKAESADIIALSALMTTTMIEMKKVVEKAKEAALNTRIIIGGAVITAQYAEEIGADGYAPDAGAAVGLVRRLINN